MITTLAEAVVEDAALDWLEGLDWRVAHGAEVSPDTLGAERGEVQTDYVAACTDE